MRSTLIYVLVDDRFDRNEIVFLMKREAARARKVHTMTHHGCAFKLGTSAFVFAAGEISEQCSIREGSHRSS